jgi:hypothetical protein
MLSPMINWVELVDGSRRGNGPRIRHCVKVPDEEVPAVPDEAKEDKRTAGSDSFNLLKRVKIRGVAACILIITSVRLL